MKAKPKLYPIPTSREFFQDLVLRGNELDNLESAIEFNVGDHLLFYDWSDKTNLILRAVICKLSDGSYTFQNKKCEIEKVPHNVLPLELDERAKRRRDAKV